MNENIIPKDLRDPINWKRTYLKNHDVYLCKPKIGTQVTNKFSGITYRTNSYEPYIVSGTCGELSVLNENCLIENYKFVGGFPVSKLDLNLRTTDDGLLDWVHVTCCELERNVYWATYLPLSIRNLDIRSYRGDACANKDGVNHGVGDFLVCSDMNGKPNLNDIWVVNGNVFPKTYDMRAFPGLVSSELINAVTPKPSSILQAKEVSNNIKIDDNNENNYFKPYRSWVKLLSNKIMQYYAKYSNLNIHSMRLNEFKHGHDGNYQMLEDYNYVDFRLTFTAGNSPVEVNIRCMDTGDISNAYADIYLNDGIHSGSLNNKRNAFKERGIKINNFEEEHLVDYFNRLFGVNTQIKRDNNQRNINKPKDKNMVMHIFNMFR